MAALGQISLRPAIFGMLSCEPLPDVECPLIGLECVFLRANFRRDFANPMMGGSQVEVFGRISGNDIFLSNSRSGFKRNRYS